MKSDQAIIPAEEQTRLSTADVAASAPLRAPPVLDRPADDRRADNGRTQVENRPSVPASDVKKPAEGGSVADGKDSTAPLFARQEAEEMRSRWSTVQTGFVDEPRRAVEQADNLVAQTVQRLAAIFADERNQLEQTGSRGDDVSTEDLRLALQRYRSFFDRLLSV